MAFEAEITETSDIGNLTIVLPAGGGLDDAAANAVSQWKYKPTIVNGHPVCVVTTITVDFEFSQ